VDGITFQVLNISAPTWLQKTFRSCLQWSDFEHLAGGTYMPQQGVSWNRKYFILNSLLSYLVSRYITYFTTQWQDMNMSGVSNRYTVHNHVYQKPVTQYNLLCTGKWQISTFITFTFNYKPLAYKCATAVPFRVVPLL
jgi:hypothetical protein